MQGFKGHPFERVLHPLRTALVQPKSLQLTLTLRIVAILSVGLSGVTLWTCWKTQDILVASHKKTLQETAQRIEEDVTLYREMLTLEASIRKALQNRSANNLWIGVKRPDSPFLVAEPLERHKSLMDSPLIRDFAERLPPNALPDAYQIQGHDLVACSGPLTVRRTQVGTLYLIHDITEDQSKFYQLTRSLVLANLTALVLLIVMVAYELRRLLLPLNRVSQMTQAISVEDFGDTPIAIAHAPREVQDLVKTFNMLLQRLAEAWQQQRAAAEQQRQFVSNVSHELRTPLTIVRGYIESTLRRSHNLTDSQQEALNIAVAETDHTIRVLQDLLDLARADDGYMPYQSELLVLNDIISDVVKVVGQFSNRKLCVDAPDLISVYADAHRLKQVLVNLLENAIKYSTPNTPVQIHIERQHQTAHIHVRDYGPGIPLKHQARIFERFYRVDEARNRSSGGTGLGLALVKTFIEGMGGTVSVQSRPEEGSTFTLTLPTTPSTSKPLH